MELVLNNVGVSLSRDNEGFVISNADGRQRIPSQGITSIQVGKGAVITSDAILLAIENEIDVMFMDRTGKPMGRIWSPKFGSISTIRKGQINFSFSQKAVEWIKEVICTKLENQQALMLLFSADADLQTRTLTDKNINRLEDYQNKIKKLDGEIVSDISPTLRGWEGVASKIFFDTINLFIPEKYRFEKRSQHPAMDIANAMFNYGYGLLYGKIEGALIKAGVDPYVGIMHRDDYNRPVLVYDVIEIYRVWVEFVVVSLLEQSVITDEFYSIREDGSYWLEPLGRRILIQSLNDYLEEVVEQNGMKRSRLTQISLYAQKLSSMFKNFA